MDLIDRFDPFNNRLCRNVRNALSEAFRTAIAENDMDPVRQVADAFIVESVPRCVADYIHKRLDAYASVLKTLNSEGAADPLMIALTIWDRHLFFETHEYLEPFWMAASGEEKRLFQALIRAAGTYVHLEQGNLPAARRIAAKAIEGLAHGKDRLAVYTDPTDLLDRLKRLDPIPPTLSGAPAPAESSSGG